MEPIGPASNEATDAPRKTPSFDGKDILGKMAYAHFSRDLSRIGKTIR